MKAIKDGNEIRIEDCYLHKESIKEIPGRRYDAVEKAWYTPCNGKNVALLQMLGAELCEELRAFVRTDCNNDITDETPVCEMPIKATPYKHQVRAFNFAMKILANGKGGDEKHDSKK